MIRKKLVYTLLLSLLLISTFTPWRTMTQGLPFVILAMSLIMDKPDTYLYSIIKPFIWLFFLAIPSAIFNASPIVNLLFGIITWMGGITAFIIAYTFGKYVSLTNALKILLLISLIQVPIGLYQVFSAVEFKLINPFLIAASVGDNFSGTLLLSGVNSHIVGLKLLFSLLIVYFLSSEFFKSTSKKILFLLLLLVGWIFPSAIHSFLCFALGILTYIIFTKGLKAKFIGRIFISVIFVFFLILSIQEFAIGYIETLIKKSTYISYETPHKIVALYETIFNLSVDNPIVPILGLGLGRYSSYAAMILSGEMLRYQPWYIPISISAETDRFILPYWNKTLLESNVWAHGVANQPWFTYMSIYGELGVPGLMLFIVFFISILRRLKAIEKLEGQPLLRNVAMALSVFTFFLLYLFFFDNWFEDARLMVPYFVILGITLRKSNTYL
jgi:hypothetical protein